MRSILEALKRVWEDAVSRRTAILGLLILWPLYAATLPAAFTGGRIGWVSLKMLTPSLAVLATGLSVFLALTLSMMVWLIRQGYKSSKGTAAGGATIALLTPILCCSPLLPLAIGGLAVAFPALAGAAAGRVQAFIAIHEIEILSVALVLTAVAFLQNARRVAAGTHCRVSNT
ncbi:hypothetical protein [Saccharospirillum salsuginis]|uniref:Uncharacterized protein n=1 Tax=Saccharospirillum salsuginis TaxID=418750 RepID=A0A918KQE0_9GAMM|nr:hypothetical protein [Saccharospirillum salsuginis]GGX70814.1 hypothetical protein GCM10007392_42870 [Saccharospirillum salsuginis]